ncbi:MAG TPA: hypothetical protein ENK55_09870, partial [Actinobacteria bacterium]|nr:hypothetical protein [Actinomycetota bacterium]
MLKRTVVVGGLVAALVVPAGAASAAPAEESLPRLEVCYDPAEGLALCLEETPPTTAPPPLVELPPIDFGPAFEL